MLCPQCNSIMILKEEDVDKRVYECPNCGLLYVKYKIFDQEVDGCEYRGRVLDTDTR